MSKIDLIIDALEAGLKLSDGFISEWNQINKALAAARELKALKPVAWMAWNMPDDRYEITTDKRRKKLQLLKQSKAMQKKEFYLLVLVHKGLCRASCGVVCCRSWWFPLIFI